MDKDRTSVLLNKEIMAKLKSIGLASNKSTSFLIQEAVSEYVAKKSPPKKLGIIGIADSELPDLAEKDEEYLKKSGFGED